jgi:hypothetical protein
VWSPPQAHGSSAPSFYDEIGDAAEHDAGYERRPGLGVGAMIVVALVVMIATGVATAWFMGVSFDALLEPFR